MNTYIIELRGSNYNIMCDSYATALEILVNKANSNIDYVLLNAKLLATTDTKEVQYSTKAIK